MCVSVSVWQTDYHKLDPTAILACHLAALVHDPMLITFAGLLAFTQLLGAKAASLCLCTPMLSVEQQIWLWQYMQPFQKYLLKINYFPLHLTAK